MKIKAGLAPRMVCLALSAASVAFLHLAMVSAAFACALLLFLWTGTFRNRRILHRFLGIHIFLAFFWLTIPISVPGTSLFGIGSLVITKEGLVLALETTLKCEALFLAFSALLNGVEPTRMGGALSSLHLPSKFIFLFVFLCRYVEEAGREWDRLYEAAILRGFKAKTDIHTYKTLANMLALSFLNGSRRSRRVWEAMLLRGFFHHFTMLEEESGGRIFCLVWGTCLFLLLMGELTL